MELEKIDSSDNRTLEMRMLMSPDKANFSGKNVHGGEILRYLDQVAYSCAARYAGTYVVTLCADTLFKKPIKIGSIVTFYARINYVGNTSMEVGVKIISENLKTKEVEITNTCYFTMISVDDDGNPLKVKPLEIRDSEEQRRYNRAKERSIARRMLFKRDKNN